MKVLEHPAVVSFGATSLILLILLTPFASDSHEVLYHLCGSVSAVIVPVLLNFAAMWLFLTLLLLYARRKRWFAVLLWSALAIGLPWVVMKDCFFLGFDELIPPGANLVFLATMLCGVAALFVLRSRAGAILSRVRKLGTTLLVFAALSGAVELTTVIVFAWQARNLNTARPMHRATTSTTSPHGPILWIVLDEASYRQIYEHRYPGLQLPAFDQLAAQSTVFSHVVPAGMFTADVLPALITGTPVEDTWSPAAGQPLSLQSGGKWDTLDSSKTVFQDAIDTGYRPAVAGWYNPYCRILPHVLDQCFWTFHIGLPGGMIPGRSILWNAQQPVLHHLVTLLARLSHAFHPLPTPVDTPYHQQDYNELLNAGDKLLHDPSVDFILLHMPIPHPGGIYNRHTHSFATSHPTYLDNLALCDLYLAHIKQLLEQNGSWDNTTLVLMGDHSWRVKLWSKTPDWTAEEKAASDGTTFDDRPLYLVKLPKQTTPAQIDTPYPALQTRNLLDSLLTGQITTPQQLETWAQQPR